MKILEISLVSLYEGITITIVSSLVLFTIISLSKRKPEWGGILSSFPTSVALILIFTAVFNGAETVRTVAMSLSAAIVLFNIWILSYYNLSKKTRASTTAILSLMILALFALLYQFINTHFIVLFFVYGIVWFIGSRFFYPLIKLKQVYSVSKNNSLILIITCAVYVAVIVSLSKFTAPLITAVLSAFPTSALFGAYYNQRVSSVNLSRFLGSMYIATPTISLFCLVITLTSSLSIMWSFIAGFGVAIICAFVFSRVVRNIA